MKQRKPRKIGAWALVQDRKIVLYHREGAAVHPMLIFKAKWLAEAAKWLPGEKVVKIEISVLS